MDQFREINIDIVDYPDYRPIVIVLFDIDTLNRSFFITNIDIYVGDQGSNIKSVLTKMEEKFIILFQDVNEGTVPILTKKSFDLNKSDLDLLKNEFGDNWFDELNIHIIKNLFIDTDMSGGDHERVDVDDDEDEYIDQKVLIDHTNMDETIALFKDDEDEFHETSKDDDDDDEDGVFESTSNSFGDQSLIDIPELSLLETHDKSTDFDETQIDKMKTNKMRMKFVYKYIDDDKIVEIKEKIFIEHDIPTPFQYLSYIKSFDSKTKFSQNLLLHDHNNQLGYSVVHTSSVDSSYPIDNIFSLFELDSKNVIINVPIDTKFPKYVFRDMHFHIYNNENKQLKEYINRDNRIITCVSVLNSINQNRSVFMDMIRDAYGNGEADLLNLYQGFIGKYFPEIFSYEIFKKSITLSMSQFLIDLEIDKHKIEKKDRRVTNIKRLIHQIKSSDFVKHKVMIANNYRLLNAYVWVNLHSSKMIHTFIPRSLGEIIHTDDIVHLIKYKDVRNNRMIFKYNKSYYESKLLSIESYKNPMNVIEMSIRVSSDPKSKNYLRDSHITIYPHGLIKIQTSWTNEFNAKMKDTVTGIKTLKKIIDEKINTIEPTIFLHPSKLTSPSFDNVSIFTINMCFDLPYALDINDYVLLRAILISFHAFVQIESTDFVSEGQSEIYTQKLTSVSLDRKSVV